MAHCTMQVWKVIYESVSKIIFHKHHVQNSLHSHNAGSTAWACKLVYIVSSVCDFALTNYINAYLIFSYQSTIAY